MDKKGAILFYKTEDGKSQLDVRLEDETIWLNQYQLADLLKTDRTSIPKHISNIYKSRELSEKSTCAKFAQVQKEGNRVVTREIQYYNLDMIISVGYRVNSKRGTQFRIWATQTLKDHLIKGYTINEKRLQEQQKKWKELQQTVEFLKTTVGKKELTSKETHGLLEIISQYTRSFVLLNKFDNKSLETTSSEKKLTYYYKSYQRIKSQPNKPFCGDEPPSKNLGFIRFRPHSLFILSTKYTVSSGEVASSCICIKK